jgi:hypothetical protein
MFDHPQGDPYYTPECLTRKNYYNADVSISCVNGIRVPAYDRDYQSYQEWCDDITNTINDAYTQPAEADISGTFSISGNSITITGSVTPSISAATGYKLYVVVNEKETYKNKGTNGETAFYHVMMKMFPNGEGQEVPLTAGTAIPFNYTHNMSTTHVEDMYDLEVAVFVQNISTKAILNAAYLEDITPALLNVSAAQREIDLLDVDITWENISELTPDGYNIYRNDVKLNSALLTGTSYQDVAPELGKAYTYAVEMVTNGTGGYKGKSTVIINVTLPLPVITSATQLEGGLEMLVEWEIPETQYPVKYNVYRNEELITPIPITETSLVNTGASYREYCFEIEPVYNDATGAKSSRACVTLLGITEPDNELLFTLYPNPANGNVTIEGNGLNRVEIYDLQGRKLTEYNNVTDNLRINVNSLTDGLYFVKLYAEDRAVAVRRLVVMK